MCYIITQELRIKRESKGERERDKGQESGGAAIVCV
jgi:hypothetical protein